MKITTNGSYPDTIEAIILNHKLGKNHLPIEGKIGSCTSDIEVIDAFVTYGYNVRVFYETVDTNQGVFSYRAVKAEEGSGLVIWQGRRKFTSIEELAKRSDGEMK